MSAAAKVAVAAAGHKQQPMPLYKLRYLRSFTATEIRCQEKSKGGLSYEVILAEPSVTSPPLKRSGSSASKPATSAEDIEEKLRAAEERRMVS